MSNKIVTLYRLRKALSHEIESDQVFIISNEKRTSSGRIGRCYTVFPSYRSFREKRDSYPHCHEIITDHKNNTPDPSGRLVFDFDIPSTVKVPRRFKDQIETAIMEVLLEYYRNVDMDIIEFVWSSSENPSKFSKHLTVKNVCFEDWIKMTRVFYELFAKKWKSSHSWIKAKKLVDWQIVRRNGTLRMVGSSKIGGYPLVMDDPDHCLEDSLIRIYRRRDRNREQILGWNNLKKKVYREFIKEEDDHDIRVKTRRPSLGSVSAPPAYDQKVYDKAFGLVERFSPGIFDAGKINGQLLPLERKLMGGRRAKRVPSECLISGTVHENDNAFLVITKVVTNPNTGRSHYRVYYSCHRKCRKDGKRRIILGSINPTSLRTTPNRGLKVTNAPKKKRTIPKPLEIII